MFSFWPCVLNECWWSSADTQTYCSLDWTSEKRVAWVVGFDSFGISTQRERQKGEIAESPDTAASAETQQRRARPQGLKESWMSLCVSVRSCVEWSVKDWDAESQLCPLSWDLSEAQRNPPCRPSRQREQFTARTGSSDRRKTPLWPMNNYWSNLVGTESLVFLQAGTYY